MFVRSEQLFIEGFDNTEIDYTVHDPIHHRALILLLTFISKLLFTPHFY